MCKSCLSVLNHVYLFLDRHMRWLWFVGSIKLQVSSAKEPYKRDYILQKETYGLIDPTNRSHPICRSCLPRPDLWRMSESSLLKGSFAKEPYKRDYILHRFVAYVRIISDEIMSIAHFCEQIDTCRSCLPHPDSWRVPESCRHLSIYSDEIMCTAHFCGSIGVDMTDVYRHLFRHISNLP